MHNHRTANTIDRPFCRHPRPAGGLHSNDSRHWVGPTFRRYYTSVGYIDWLISTLPCLSVRCFFCAQATYFLRDDSTGSLYAMILSFAAVLMTSGTYWSFSRLRYAIYHTNSTLMINSITHIRSWLSTSSLSKQYTGFFVKRNRLSQGPLYDTLVLWIRLLS